MLIRKDKSPNRKGVEEILKAVSAKMIGFGEAQRMMERVPGQALGVAKGQGEGKDKREAKIQAVVVLGEGMSGAYEFDPLSRLPLNNLAFSLFAGSFRFDHMNSFKILLPTATWVETEGSFTNCEGFVQRIAAPVFPFKQSRPLWQIVQELGARMGSVHHFRSASAIFERLSEEIPAFHGIHYRELAKKGVRL